MTDSKNFIYKFRVLFLMLISTLTLMANPYILTHDGLIDQRAQDKIFEIGSETKQKLGVNIYVDIKENNGLNVTLPREKRILLMKSIEKNIVKDIKKPYAVLVIAVDQKYANILMSDDLVNIIDRDDILDGYVIPLLASKDKNTLFAKTSAALLNGFAQMADAVADSKNIKLESSIGSAGKVAGTIWKMLMYTLVLTGIILYIVIIMREKKYKNMTKEEFEELKQMDKNGK